MKHPIAILPAHLIVKTLGLDSYLHATYESEA